MFQEEIRKSPTIFLHTPRKSVKFSPSLSQPAVCAVKIQLESFKESLMNIQFVVDLQRNVVLPIYGVRKFIKSLILFLRSVFR